MGGMTQISKGYYLYTFANQYFFLKIILLIIKDSSLKFKRRLINLSWQGTNHSNFKFSFSYVLVGETIIFDRYFIFPRFTLGNSPRLGKPSNTRYSSPFNKRYKKKS